MSCVIFCLTPYNISNKITAYLNSQSSRPSEFVLSGYPGMTGLQKNANPFFTFFQICLILWPQSMFLSPHLHLFILITCPLALYHPFPHLISSPIQLPFIHLTHSFTPHRSLPFTTVIFISYTFSVFFAPFCNSSSSNRQLKRTKSVLSKPGPPTD